jgi:outer membrane protein
MLVVFLSSPIRAETMSGALARAYANNPNLNQQRAAVRSLDENVPKARAGWLPTVGLTGYAGRSYLYQRDPPSRKVMPDPGVDPAEDESTKPPRGQKFRSFPRGYGVGVSQPVFDGFKTLNSLRQAEAQIFGGREDLRSVEQDTLMGGATAYMDVLRDTAILGLRAKNIEVLKEQVKQTRARGGVGQATETDVAQVEAALAEGRSAYFAARGDLQASMATFRQIVGVEAQSLQPARSLEALLPKHLNHAVEIGQRGHPAIGSAIHAADAAAAAVKVAESALYPTASIAGAVNRDLDVEGMTGKKSFSANIFGQINIPIYQGGAEYASIRQAKEQLGQARLMADLQRNQVRANIVASWGRLSAARSQIDSTRAAVVAAEIALTGIRGEALVGQRTTFDILSAQQTLLNARVANVTAQRDRIVASYATLAAIGRLTAADLNLTSRLYDPTLHFNQVKGRLFGTGVP